MRLCVIVAMAHSRGTLYAMKKKLTIALICLIAVFGLWMVSKKMNLNPSYSVGQPIDSLNNVIVFYNGGVNNVEERNTVDGYNLGLKYQCVEFVKRYYYEHYNHKMPDTYGHAKDFYNSNLTDGQLNTQRGLIQYSNPSSSKPKIGDLIVMDATIFNSFGHVAIVSDVKDESIEIIQQNSGPYSSSRDQIDLKNDNNKWLIQNTRILGWLSK